jgi:hypothetical protein
MTHRPKAAAQNPYPKIGALMTKNLNASRFTNADPNIHPKP